jgi:hypothetical protein
MSIRARETEGGKYVRNEATLQQREQSSASKKAGPTREPKLRTCDYRPQDHLSGYPAIRAHPFGDQLRGQLRAKEAEFEDSVSPVVI